MPVDDTEMTEHTQSGEPGVGRQRGGAHAED